MAKSKMMAVVSLWSLALTGCAGTVRWTQGTPEALRPYYYQGIGYSRALEKADHNARIALATDREGMQVESVTEDSMRSVQTETGERYIEIFTSKGVIRIKGDIPKGAYIADRWHGKSLYWSYALLEKPGQKRVIERLRRERLRRAGLKSIVPGWAQFTKREHRKAWNILALEGGSMLGTAVLGVLTSDMITKRDRAPMPSRS